MLRVESGTAPFTSHSVLGWNLTRIVAWIMDAYFCWPHVYHMNSQWNRQFIDIYPEDKYPPIALLGNRQPAEHFSPARATSGGGRGGVRGWWIALTLALFPMSNPKLEVRFRGGLPQKKSDYTDNRHLQVSRAPGRDLFCMVK